MHPDVTAWPYSSPDDKDADYGGIDNHFSPKSAHLDIIAVL